MSPGPSADLELGRKDLVGPSPSDSELAIRVAQGDATALEALYDRYSSQVYGMASYILRDPAGAEDVTQEVFISLWTRADRFDPERGIFRHWFLHLAHNRVIDELRRRRRITQSRADKAPEDAELALEAPADTAKEALSGVMFGQAQEALNQLPEPQREAIVMAYMQGLTQQEIADATSVPLGTVKTRMRLGLIKLRDLLAEPGEGEG